MNLVESCVRLCSNIINNSFYFLVRTCDLMKLEELRFQHLTFTSLSVCISHYFCFKRNLRTCVFWWLITETVLWYLYFSSKHLWISWKYSCSPILFHNTPLLKKKKIFELVKNNTKVQTLQWLYYYMEQTWEK